MITTVKIIGRLRKRTQVVLWHDISKHLVDTVATSSEPTILPTYCELEDRLSGLEDRLSVVIYSQRRCSPNIFLSLRTQHTFHLNKANTHITEEKKSPY